MTNRQNHYFISRLVLWVTLWLMVLLLGVKISTGWEIQSLSLLAQSLHTLIVCFSLLFGWLTAISPDRPTGREIYGHGKRETFLVLLFAAAVTLAWVSLFGACIQQLLAAWNQTELPFPVQGTISLLQFSGFLVAVTLVLGLLNHVQGRVCRYPIVRFNANQLFKEAVLMFLATASLVGVWWGEPLFDLLTAAVLLILAADSFWQVLDWHFPLLVEQTAIAPEVLEREIGEIEGVSQCYNVRSRGIIGRFVYISMHLILEPGDSKLAPQIARKIEQVLRDRYGPLQITCTIESDHRRN